MTDENSPPAPSPHEIVGRMIMGFRTTQLIHVAAELGIADRLADGPRDVAALAHAVGAEPRALYRLLRALASLGLFAETADGRFELTPLAQLLRADAPRSLRDLARLYGDPWVWDVYGRTLHSVRTGGPAFEHVHGRSLFEHLHRDARAALAFDRGMTGYSEQEAAAILRAYDFPGVSTLVDVGGGQGALLTALLSAVPGARGVLFEQPDVLERARDALTRAGVADRCALASGDFFTAVPAGGDVYVLKSILHNWDDARARAILARCRDAMPRAARLLVIERVVPDGAGASDAKLFDINMLVMLGGLERTVDEYRRLLAEGGFALSRVVSTDSALSILEAVPAVVP